MSNLDKAIADLADIRSLLTEANLFRGFGPAVIAGTGLIALSVMAIQLVRPEQFASSPVQMLTMWVLCALLATSLIGLEMLALSRRHHGKNALTMCMHILEAFFPAAIAGALIGIIVMTQAPEQAWILPGIWQICIGVGTFASVRFLPRQVYFAAAFYLIAGAAVLIIASQSQSVSPLHMGIPFGIGQFIMAATLKLFTAQRKGSFQ